MSVLAREAMAWSGSIEELIRLLGRSLCLEVLTTLAEGERDVTDLSNRLQLEPSRVSATLGQLARHGLVMMRRDKKRHLYTLGPALTSERCGTELTFVFTDIDDGSLLIQFHTHGSNGSLNS